MALTLAEQLMYTTVRLECDLGNGAVSTGTGFFFYADWLPSGQQTIFYPLPLLLQLCVCF
ncbi:MAG: hypothetical protein IEMM0001_2069 [bacterium]|nr:MAG: hypothetical protein IEMM0001_2069 [bacterium]